MNKKGFEFSFAWLFALIVGAVILFLAIYFASKIVSVGRYQLATTTAKQLSIIFEPMETGLASGKSNIARLREETRIYNDCFLGGFGKQEISLSEKSSFGKKWQEPGGEISIPNKYIFSEDIEQGKEVYFFSKPFEMPWKISEIIFLSMKKYCFVKAPEEIVEEVEGLKLQNINLEECKDKEIKVCFDSVGCEIEVEGRCLDCESEYDYGYVEKDGERLFYIGSLIYGAIFSNKEIYECNVKRLMNRLTKQALLFRDETNFLVGRCETLPSSGLLQIVNLATLVDNSEKLLLVYNQAKQVDEQNDAAQCQLW